MVNAVRRNHDGAAMPKSMGRVDLRVKNPGQGNPNNAIGAMLLRLMGRGHLSAKKVVIKTRRAGRRAIGAIIGRTAVIPRNPVAK